MSSHALSTPNRPLARIDAPAKADWDIVEVTPLLDLDDLFGIIRRRLVWLILLPSLGLASALAYVFLVAKPLFQSKALVFVDPMFDRALQIQPTMPGMSDLDSLNSLEKAIVSDTMVLRVIDKLDLRSEPGFLPSALQKLKDADQEIPDSRLLKDLRKQRFSASLIRPTRLLELSVLDPDPVRAQRIATAFVEEFESFLGDQKRHEAGNSAGELRQRADEAYQNALNAEKELEKFRMEHPDLTVEQDHQLFAERLTKMGEELNAVSGKVFNLRSRVETLRVVDPEQDPIKVINLGGFSEIEHVSELLNQRLNAHAALASISGQFTPTHPRYREAQSRVEEIDTQLKALAVDLKQTLEADYAASVTNEKLLSERVGELQTQLTSVKTASSQFRAIQQRVETEWQIHQTLRERIGQTSIESEKSTNVTRLMSEPIVAHKPSKPSKPIAALIGLVAGGMMGCSLVGVDLLRAKPFANRRQVEQRLSAKVVAEIATPARGGNDRELMDAMTRVLLSPEHRGASILHLSSLRENEEGLRVAACLASASAFHACPTLLVSIAPGGDPRLPVNLVPVASQTENLHTLRLPASFLIAPQDTWQLLSPHRQRFNRIVIESTAFTQETQIPAAVAPLADANLVLVDRHHGTRQQISESVSHLARGTHGPISVILQS
ncbi:MAG: GumC family protein [Verrucomicrobiae bacterium]|nr:GumC family protein [Verrucomicrobiae bacterium]